MAPFTLRARWVLPIETPPIEGGYVGVANGRITSVGQSNPGAAPVADLGDAVLLPGLINAHTHLEFSGCAQPLGAANMSLPDWIRLVIADRGRGNRDASAAIHAGLNESLAAGVTTLGDIATTVEATPGVDEARPSVVTFQEAIGFSAGRIDSAFANIVERLSATPAPAGVSPHAPYTVHPLLLQRLVDLASQRRQPMAMHLAESREELRLLQQGDGPFRDLLEERSMWDPASIPAGTRPLDYLRTLAEAPRTLVIHGNYLDAEEIEFLAVHRERMSVVYCPRTHEYFGHEPYPLLEMERAGVRVVFGTDSRASNPDLNLLNEMRSTAARHSGVSPEQLLSMATIESATALGMAEDVGSLSEGKRADLVAFACDELRQDPYEGLLMGAAAPAQLWLRGRQVDLSTSRYCMNFLT